MSSRVKVIIAIILVIESVAVAVCANTHRQERAPSQFLDTYDHHAKQA